MCKTTPAALIGFLSTKALPIWQLCCRFSLGVRSHVCGYGRDPLCLDERVGWVVLGTEYKTHLVVILYAVHIRARPVLRPLITGPNLLDQRYRVW